MSDLIHRADIMNKLSDVKISQETADVISQILSILQTEEADTPVKMVTFEMIQRELRKQMPDKPKDAYERGIRDGLEMAMGTIGVFKHEAKDHKD